MTDKYDNEENPNDDKKKSKGKRPRKYKVGYKKPPEHTRFKKGQSGNPKGRPKHQEGGILTGVQLSQMFVTETTKLITVIENNRKVERTQFEVMLKQVMHKAMKGDMRSFLFIVKTLQDISVSNDEALTKAFAEQRRKNLKRFENIDNLEDPNYEYADWLEHCMEIIERKTLRDVFGEEYFRYRSFDPKTDDEWLELKNMLLYLQKRTEKK